MGPDLARSILVIRAGALGDFVLTLPVLDAIRCGFPEARITLLGYPAIAELALVSGRADALADVGSARFAPLFGATNTPPAELRAWLSGSSGSPGFDAAVAVWSDAPSFLAPKLRAAGIREVFCVEPMPPAGERRYAAEFMLRQLPAGWRDGVACEPSLELASEGVRAADLPWNGAGPLCAVAPGSGGRGPDRNWPPARFAELCEGAATELGMRPFLVHGPADDEAVAAVLELVELVKLPVVRGLRTVQLAVALAASDAYVGNDSGVSHLAAAVGTPTVAVFGCTDPLVWGPRGGHVRVLDAGFPGCVEIDRISAGDVLETLRMLRRTQDREGPPR